MDWKDEEVEDMAKRAFECSPTAKEYAWVEATEAWKKHARDVAQVVATRAVELAAARAGTDLGPLEAAIISATRGPADADLRRAWMSALHALGARNAVLEAAKERTLSDWREYKAAKDADVAGWKEENERLKERLSAAEEGNRELVRRAQQAEAQRDAHRSQAREWERLRNDAYRNWRAASDEIDKLKARCVTLSAAGQVLSAHVDKADAECCHPVPRTQSGHRLHTLDCPVNRYPCSPTCTHDDAAKPGHPERVKERSEAVSEELRRPENDADTFATIPNGVEGVVFTRSQTERYADKRAEAMRAACWEVVQAIMQKYGIGPVMREDMKRAIEGTAP